MVRWLCSLSLNWVWDGGGTAYDGIILNHHHLYIDCFGIEVDEGEGIMVTKKRPNTNICNNVISIETGATK